MSDKNEISSEFDFETTFPPLGHSEHHFTKYPNHPWLKTKDEIELWLKEYVIGFNDTDGYILHDDYTIDLNIKSNSFRIKSCNKINKIPIQLRKIRIFHTNGNVFDSAIGMPYKVTFAYLPKSNLTTLEGVSKNSRLIDVIDNKIENFIGLPENYRGSLIINGNPISSWDGFTSCKKIDININYELLIQAPIDIEQIEVLNNDPKINHLKHFDSLINMPLLREEQYKIKRIINNNNKINNLINNEGITNKKRKI